MENKLVSTFDYKLIYIFRINDGKHNNLLKIGDATIHNVRNIDDLHPNCHDLNVAAKERIDSYTSTAGIVYELLYTELAIAKNSKGKIKAFRDHDVHDVLTRSGIEKYYFETNKKQNEWFKTDLQTAINSIRAVKEGKTALDNCEITTKRNPIIFRPEQNEAIDKTIKVFKNSDAMLWNAKMRFGKTLSALQIIKKLNFNKTIIITHRPAVNDGWFQDFDKIFYDSPEYCFSSKNKGRKIEELLRDNDKKIVYFASMQDLRGSDQVGGNFDKNSIIFKIDWDFVIIDEAHEGTTTNLGEEVKKAIIKPTAEKTTKLLELSGTPFNIITEYNEEQIYTWDYIMEQEAKYNWPIEHFGDSNPYEELPKMNIFTYHLDKVLKNFIDIDDKAFNFKEFFRTWSGDVIKDKSRMPSDANVGDFVHERDILSFLNLLCKKDDKSNYPFSTDEYREYFRHTLWMVPGVKEAKALSKLLREHPVFSQFDIVNVAGDGDEETDPTNALKSVYNKITDKPEDTYTITLSCGRLTVGVSVPEWTAVLYLAGSYSTAASQYMQTIFRVQTPANINGRIKENCYVFDFAPDRTIKMVAEGVQLSSHNGNSGSDEVILGKFLNFCPVVAIDESEMKRFKVNALLQDLKRAYAERVVRNGFDDTKLYNEGLFHLTDDDLSDFEELKKKIGSSTKSKTVDNIIINKEGYDEESYEEVKRIEKKKKSERTPEEIAKLEELKKIKENRSKAMAILRSISIRIPLMVYGIDKDIDIDVTVDNFADKDLIDDLSWEEFMPEGVTREVFKKFAKYYDKDVFVAASRRIRHVSRSADELEPTERLLAITKLFSTFKNPDKETVLTPWKVVNMHMKETLGGYVFLDEDYNLIEKPKYISNEKITKEVLEDENTNVLEINSKTGLYPLYVVYSIYRNIIKDSEPSFEEKLRIWDYVVENNMFVVCKTPMAKSITRRTLVGYREAAVNTRYFEDLINQLKDARKESNFVEKVTSKSFWKGREGGNEKMKFKAVVGNPPYQGNNHQQVYPYFYLSSIKLADYVSLIFPIGWQAPKNGNNLKMMNNQTVKQDKQIVFIDNRQNVFPGVSGAEWVNVILWNRGFDNNLNGKQRILTNGTDENITQLDWEYSNASKPKEILEIDKIIRESTNFKSITEITTKRNPFGISTDFFKKFADYGLEEISTTPKNENDIKIYGASNKIFYVPKDFKFPKINTSVEKFKVLVPYAWGNMSEDSGLGGAFADIIVASPNEAATETYLVSGIFDDKETAKKHAKYLMTKFARSLLYVNKSSQHSTQSFGSIPRQDYKEEWWNSNSIKEIDEHLMEKYNIPDDIKNFIFDNFQTKKIDNIINY